ncbi:MAG: anti-sigma F factor [Eubacteriales bacterium]|nr:anti-sigma F factor [Eubacteriales bacterium]
MKNNMKLIFDARGENEALSRMVTAAFLAPLNPTVEELTDIKTAVSEAVTNAILHGYDSDPAKQVELSCQFSDRTVTVTVRDRGHGIEDIALAMEPFYTSRPELERSGMGFTVMQTFMDELEVHSAREEGTVVRMTKRLSPRDEGVAP